MVRVVDVKAGPIDLSNAVKVTQEVYEDFSKGRDPEIGDLIISRVGSYGNICYVKTNEKFCLGQNTAFIVPKINWRFLYYQLLSPQVRTQIESLVVGAVQKTISLKNIKSLEIATPSKSEQKAIAHILGTLDDKIELNRRMNETLEAMAQALFKSWFVDFDPVKAKMEGRQPEGMDAETAALFPDKLVESELGLIPEGWGVGQIGNEVTVVGGSTPSTKKPGYWDGGTVHWTTPKDLSGSSDKIIIETARKITEEGLQKIHSGLLPVDTVLLSSRAPVGYLALAKVPIAINQGYIGMKCEKALSPEYVLQWCVSVMDKILQRASGTTFAEISKKNFKPIAVVVPFAQLIKIYSKIVSDIYSKIENNLRENSELSNVRDTLLPELISGKLNVSDWQ